MKKLFIFSTALVLSALMQAYASQGVGFWLNGVELKVSGTYTDSSLGIKKGSVKYDRATNTLTLIDAVIESDIHDALYIWGDEPCTLMLDGGCAFRVNSANKAGISLDYALKGTDLLHLTITKNTNKETYLAIESKNIGIYAETENKGNTRLSIKNVRINNYAENYGITAKSGQRLMLLTHEGTYLYIQPTFKGAIENIVWPDQSTYIVFPNYVSFNSLKGGVYENTGEFYKGELVIATKAVSLSYNPEVALMVGETAYELVTSNPRNTLRRYTWTSDNTSVATVDSFWGEITAKAAGTARITAETRDGSGKIATINVTVGAPLYVAGTQVTSENASNIPGLASGRASYDIKTKTLTLNGATINAPANNLGIKYYDNIIINLLNTNKVTNTANSQYAIGSDKYVKLTLQGTGSLQVSNNNSTLPALSADYLTIKGCNVTISNPNGIAVGATSSIVLENCKIQTPVNGVIGQHPTLSRIKTVLASNNTVAKLVEIVRTASGLASLHSQGIQVRGGKGEIFINAPVGTSRDLSETTVNVYNLSGALVRTAVLSPEQTSLKVDAGIYIIRIGNGAEKVVVR